MQTVLTALSVFSNSFTHVAAPFNSTLPNVNFTSSSSLEYISDYCSLVSIQFKSASQTSSQTCFLPSLAHWAIKMSVAFKGLKRLKGSILSSIILGNVRLQIRFSNVWHGHHTRNIDEVMFHSACCLCPEARSQHTEPASGFSAHSCFSFHQWIQRKLPDTTLNLKVVLPYSCT